MTKRPGRKRRAESFLGIHFDFHAGDDCRHIGRGVTPRMVENIITQVRPDYIQCDCKGHRGLSSYPTHVGYRAPGFVKDPLEIWRSVTARHGVSLYMHYSGVWDDEALKHHPSWARIDADGKRDKKNTSVFGPYVDGLLIPQLIELRRRYDVDGVWIDGDCWATCQDYRKNVLKRFREETGIRVIPRKPADKGFFEFTEFCREGFREYLRRYVDALHGYDPAYQIASNWAFSSFMPEPVCADVDFISGDYPLVNSVKAARLEGRCMMHQGKPWDLMAWAFCGKWEETGRSTKTIPQLSREAAVVLALGGGFQAYFRQNRDGAIYDWTMKLMGAVAKFCRKREALCHKAVSVPQIALLYSSAAFYRANERVFGPWGGVLEPMKGVLNALLDGQNSVDVVSEHHLDDEMDDYGLIVIPEWGYLKPAVRRSLTEYVRNGGSVLCVGPDAAKMFRKELDVQFIGRRQKRDLWLKHDAWFAYATEEAQAVRLGRRARMRGRLFFEDSDRGDSLCAGSVARLGKGRIAAIYWTVGMNYQKRQTSLVRGFLGSLVKELFKKPIVSVEGSHCIDVSVMRQRGRLHVNLVNTAGAHADANVQTHDEIPPVGPLTVAIRVPRKPKSVWLRPAGRRLPVKYAKGIATVVVPCVEIHEVLVAGE